MRWIASIAVLLLLAVPAAAQVTPSDLEEARQRLAEVRAELHDLTVQYEAALTRDAELEATIESLEARLDARRAEAADLRRRLEQRLVAMYTDAATVGIAQLFASGEPAEVETRSQYLRDVGVTDRQILNDMQVLGAQLEAEGQSLAAARVEQQAAVAALETIAEQLNARLSEAQADYDSLYAQFLEEERRRAEEARRRAEAEAARQAEAEARRQATSTTVAGDTTATTSPTTTSTVPPAPSGGGMVCPVNGIVAFTDTWGAPRSGGRFHQGVDMLAARGTPVVAVGSGVVLRMRSGGLGGITVWVETDNGDQFYYAHLDSWASGLSTGRRVAPGDLLGVVGTSGNAPAHIPHLHWEYHPGGGGAVNPTPLASQLCG